VTEILKNLNPAQQEAVRVAGGPLLILAGAGSGKTRVLTTRVAYLVAEMGVKPENILLLTFTNKAAEEMMKRVTALLRPLGIARGYVGQGGTFHSFCAKILRRYASEEGLSENFVIFDVADQLETVKQAMSRVGVDSKSVKPYSVLAAISSAKNELIGPEEYAGFARGNFSQAVARIYLAYQQMLSRYHALDFDDLLVKSVKLLQENSRVLAKLQDQYKYILVDEYQDTNKAQYQITKLLSAKDKNLTVVGDASQAIYSWRGADYRNLLLLKMDYPDLITINLEQNYRSTQTILDAAYQVISKNKNHPILKLWTDKGAGQKIKIFEAETELEEAQFVLQQIKSNYSDYAVLYRTNAQSRVLEEAFLHAGIPYTLVGGVRFYERKEVKDVLAYLRLVVNQEDEIARKRAEKNGKGRLNKLIMNSEKLTIEEPTLEILDKVLELTDYLEQYNELDEEDAVRLENIKELRSVATQFPKLVEFLENIALTERESRRAGEFKNGAVTLMTMHAAKGLEFKTVFLVGMEEGLFPHSRSLMDPAQMEEERRLCYVGMTRAMDELYLSYAQRRLFFGQRSSNMVSRFLADIPEKLIDNSGPTSPARRRVSVGAVASNWGFDESGNWKWKPDEVDF
jgi:DNA helicase II / ATP-dependent DNA helicase PcrA